MIKFQLFKRTMYTGNFIRKYYDQYDRNQAENLNYANRYVQ